MRTLFRSQISQGVLERIPELKERYDRTDSKRAFINEVLKEITFAKSTLNPHGYLSESGIDGITTAFKEFEAKLRRDSLIQFSDMVPLAAALFRNFSIALDAVHTKYHFVLVDEFQDTNSIQCDLLLSIASHGRLTVVGDVDQLIYAFQGATQQNFNQLDLYFRKQGMKVQYVSLR